MKRYAWVPVVGLSLLLLAGCGTSVANPTTSPTSNIAPPANTPSGTNVVTNSPPHEDTSTSSNQVKHQYIYLSILPGGKLGADGKKHDAFSPSEFTITQGTPVTITIYNFDDIQHSLTSSALGVNIQASRAQQSGNPGVTTVTFTPSKAGDFDWQCIDPCDLDNNQWAMSHDGYMRGIIHVLPSQRSATQDVTLTILPGGKLGPDGKKHDAFVPANFTLEPGLPVKVTILNYDTMRHSLTSSGLNLNIQANPSTKDGQAGVTTFTFTPNKTGNFSWHCIDPCDISNGDWAMFHSGYMMGTITVSDTATSPSQAANSTSSSSTNAGNANRSGMMAGSSSMMNGPYGGGMGTMMGD